jgi:Zn-dependent protease
VDDLSLDTAVLAVAWYAVFVFSTTLHEAAHALAAHWMGDNTAYQGGQVSLNPIPHIEREPVGMVVVPVASYLLSLYSGGGGWMMGWASAPYDPSWAMRYPRRAALMALAGPVGNLLLVLLAFILLRTGLRLEYFTPPDAGQLSFSRMVTAADGGLADAFAKLLSITFALNLVLFVFNLMPLPPLDGSGALPLFMPESMSRRYFDFIRQPMFFFLGIFIAWNLFGEVFPHVFAFALRMLYR